MRIHENQSRVVLKCPKHAGKQKKQNSKESRKVVLTEVELISLPPTNIPDDMGNVFGGIHGVENTVEDAGIRCLAVVTQG